MQGAPCTTPFGEFFLARYPARRKEPLQAWCAADLLLLEAAAAQTRPCNTALVINDAYGLLSLALHAAHLWTDSALSVMAMRRNAQTNGVAATPVTWSTEPPPASSLVVMRVPKQTRYFTQQLHLLSSRLPAGALVLAAGMDKHLSPHTAGLLEAHIGPTERHAGQKKARLFSAVRDPGCEVQTPEKIAGMPCPEVGGELTALPNVFSGDKLDGGARLLLKHMKAANAAQRVIDLACGNGVLGLAAFRHGLGQQVLFCDESAQAIASARNNAAALFPASPDAFSFHHGDGLQQVSGDQAQLILCNPPFHLEHTVDEFAGKRLLKQCAQYLGPGGQLLIVANRHLDYRRTLKSGFNSVSLIAEDRRFRLWLAGHAA
ncbi:MAG: methyltransferase [Halioglobus sp.]